jgi:hypothetical protein
MRRVVDHFDRRHHFRHQYIWMTVKGLNAAASPSLSTFGQ